MMTIKRMKCHDINTAVKQSDCNTCLCVFLYCLLRFGAYFHMVSEREESSGSPQTVRTCEVTWDSCTVAFPVDASTSYTDLRDAACNFFHVEREQIALLTSPERLGVRMRDLVSVNAMVAIQRDRVGGTGLESPPVALHPWDRKTYRRVVNHLESCDNAGNDRLRLFLSWIDYSTLLGETLLDAVHSAKSLTAAQIRVTYYADKDDAFIQAQTEEVLR